MINNLMLMDCKWSKLLLQQETYGGFYVVRVRTFHNEALFTERYGFVCNFCFAPLTKVTPQVVLFSVSVLAVVTNKVETAIC